MVTTDLWIKVKADEVLTGVFACLGILMFLSFTGEGGGGSVESSTISCNMNPKIWSTW